MITRAIAAKLPFSFVAADSVYGTGAIETMLRKAGKGYVLGVAANRVLHSWGKKQLVGGGAVRSRANLATSAWRRFRRDGEARGSRRAGGGVDGGDTTAASEEVDAGAVVRGTLQMAILAFFSAGAGKCRWKSWSW